MGTQSTWDRWRTREVPVRFERAFPFPCHVSGFGICPVSNQYHVVYAQPFDGAQHGQKRSRMGVRAADECVASSAQCEWSISLFVGLMGVFFTETRELIPGSRLSIAISHLRYVP